MVEEEKEDESSIISDINKSVKIPKINILGTDVKLDVISLLGLAIGGAAAIGTGYLLYDQYKNKTDVENARKKQEEDYRLQRIAYEQRLREEYNRRQQQNLIPATAKKTVPQEEVIEEEEEDNSLIDMNQYYKQPEPEKLNYEQMLARANGRYVPGPQQFQQPIVHGYQEPPTQQIEPTVIDTDRYIQQPSNQQIQVLPSVAAQPKRKQPKQVVEEEQTYEEEEGPTPDELYASLGNTGSNY